ncbi:hypothetical protein ACFVXE_27140 [Streptomyces sp. NPDC058231]|uniref:hypothetical protein n=1 Tax=Streptomyces sp. NPDC058231 TaxID=3346392 RepID=UPI0036E460BD
MTVQLAEGVTLEGYGAAMNNDIDSLKSMYTDYLLAEFQRIGEMAFGNPVGDYLTTSFIRSGGDDVGNRVEPVFLTAEGRLEHESFYISATSLRRRAP